MTKSEVLEKCKQILYGNGLSIPLKEDDFKRIIGNISKSDVYNYTENQ